MADNPEPQPEQTPAEPNLAEIQEMLASLPVESVIASSASTLHGIATAKLDRGDLEQARKAIDALSALSAQLEGDVGQEIRMALAQLQVSFASATPKP